MGEADDRETNGICQKVQFRIVGEARRHIYIPLGLGIGTGTRVLPYKVFAIDLSHLVCDNSPRRHSGLRRLFTARAYKTRVCGKQALIQRKNHDLYTTFHASYLYSKGLLVAWYCTSNGTLTVETIRSILVEPTGV